MELKILFEQNKDVIYIASEKYLVARLQEYLGENLYDFDGRTIAAIFHRFDIVEKYIKNCPLFS